MIYGKLWLVVKPTVGIPLFLSAVAVSSFLVHYMLLTHTSWMKRYYEGKPAASAQADAPTGTAAAPPALTVASTK
jgi:light-harvesting protein B-800-850 alpha chain